MKALTIVLFVAALLFLRFVAATARLGVPQQSLRCSDQAKC